MADKAVSNTGPILHLNEINFIKALAIFSRILIPEAVSGELKKYKVRMPLYVKLINLNSNSKDKVKFLTNQYSLGIGEAEAIALALQESPNYFLTDDLEARQVAKSYDIEVHGTIGIMLRAFRRKIIDKKSAIEKIKALKTNSSLFITQDLVNEAIKAIRDYST
mgnify:CR=1 FL=1